MIATLLIAALGCDPPAPSGPPNLILISVDGLRADHVGAYGRSPSPTPTLDALAEDGMYISSVGRMGRVLHAAAASMLHRKRIAVHAARSNAEDLVALAELIDEGKIRPALGERFSLSEVPEALRRQGDGRTRAKSVVRI